MAGVELQKKGNFDLPDMSFQNTSVLVRAIVSEDLRLVRFLLKKGSDPNKSVGSKKIRPLMVACHTKNKTTRLAVFKSLFKYQVNPELIDVYGQNGLMYTCAMKLKDELEVILEHFICSFYKTDIHGNTLIHVCAQHGNAEVMGVVLNKMCQYSMNINVRNNFDHTPLDEAILQRNLPCANQLRKFGCHSAFQVSNRLRRQGVVVGPAEDASISSQKPGSVSTKDSQQPSDRVLAHKAKSKSTLKDSENILYHLLDLKSQKGARVPQLIRRVPMDDKWVSTTRTHLQAIADSQEWAKQNANLFPGIPPNVMSIQTIKRMQVKTTKKLWRKVFIAATKHRRASLGYYRT